MEEIQNKVLATVADKEITQNDIDNLLRSIPPEQMMKFASEEGQKQLLEELISQELILADAREQKLDEKEEFLAEVEKIKDSVLKQFALKEILSKITISDEEVKEYYDENGKMFEQPESWQASHILVDTIEDSQKIAKEIEDGKDFAAAAAEYSKCPSKEKGGDLGFFSSGMMVQEFEDAVKSMEIGQVEKDIKTQFGYHLIKLTDKKDAGKKEFDEIKDELKKQLLLTKQEKAYIQTGEDLRKTIKVEYK